MTVGIGLLIVLALVWAAVLLPSLLRSRFLSSPIDGVRSFENAMGVLAGTRSQRRGQPATGRWIMVPGPSRRRARVIQRRRRMFERLLALALLTFILGFVPVLRWIWFVHLGVDGIVGLYVWRLVRIKQQAAPAPVEVEPAPEPVIHGRPFEAPRLVRTG